MVELIVVRRGEADLFRVLQERFARGPAPAQVIWDRRVRDRRVIIREDVSERREAERRGSAPATWSSHGFLMTRPRPVAGAADSEWRPVARPPMAPGRAQVPMGAATGPGDASPCGHLEPRGLRTDADHLRLYAGLLRRNGRQLPGQWPFSRLRGSLD
jgi:hypothetical protein